MTDENMVNKVYQNIITELSGVVIGKDDLKKALILALVADGHLLIEGLVGSGKTTLARSFAKTIGGVFKRIQFTPDIMPADVTAFNLYTRDGKARFIQGPIFANVVLADELNRTTPRTQSALLEAMNEAQVSIDGHTRKLLEPFIVIATQNPFEFEGTYFLPESQLDRFLMRLHVGYPSPDDESRILELDPAQTPLAQLKPVMTAEQLVELQRQVMEVRVDPALSDYIIRLVNATRENDQLQIGVSPRGSLMLMQAARATAMFHGRDYVVPEDISSNIIDVCAHRVIVKSHAHDANGAIASQIMRQVIETVPSPV